MFGWRARLGFLLPPGNPTIEPEMMLLGVPGVSIHFHRMSAQGETGSLEGQDERNRLMVASLDEAIEALAAVKPDLIVLAHTATSYTLGRQREAELLARLHAKTGIPVVSAYGAVLAAFERLGVKRVALGAPYSAATTEQGRAHLESCGYTVVRHANLAGVANIYDTTAEHAYRLARSIDVPEAEAVFLSGTGMPTLPVLQMLERDLGKPALSSNAAMIWHALRRCGVREPIPGYGRLLTLE